MARTGRASPLLQLRQAPESSECDYKEVFTALALTEAIYRVVSEGREAAASYFERPLGDLECSPAASSPIWWSSDGGAQRYCHFEGDDAVYVGVMGSLTLYDWLANLNVLLTDIWHPNTAAQVAAHSRGRSQHIPEELFATAQSKGKRLILCGHSLGGAVASLCALRLLQQLPPAEADNVRVMAFASPAVGNQALARAVRESGWQDCFATYLLPEDYVPRLMTPLRRPVLPDLPSLAAVVALQHRKPRKEIRSNIQPFKRRSALRRQATAQSAASWQQRSRAATTIATPPQKQQQQPSAMPLVQAASEQPTISRQWHLRLRHAVSAGVSAAVHVAGSPLRAAKTYVPFGHEVFLVAPHSNGRSLHAAVLEGMTHSVVCPTAHRMPSYRARILDVIHASAAGAAVEQALADGVQQQQWRQSLMSIRPFAVAAYLWAQLRQPAAALAISGIEEDSGHIQDTCLISATAGCQKARS